MTPLEYMESQVIKRRLNHDRELARGAPEEQLHNIRQKIGYYEGPLTLCGSRLTTMWKQIDGYRWPYRINEGGKVQKLDGGVWVDL